MCRGRCSIAGYGGNNPTETKAIICTHGSNVTGNLVDIAAIGAMTQKVWNFVVDASGTAGVFPIDVQAMVHIDIPSFTRAQSLLLPPGNRRALCQNRSAASAVKKSGGGVQTYSKKASAADADALKQGR